MSLVYNGIHKEAIKHFINKLERFKMKLINIPAGTTKICIIDNDTYFIKPIDHEIIIPEGFAKPKCLAWVDDTKEWEYSMIDINSH